MVVRCGAMCAKCCLDCFDELFEQLEDSAYSYIAITGDGFCHGAW